MIAEWYILGKDGKIPKIKRGTFNMTLENETRLITNLSKHKAVKLLGPIEIFSEGQLKPNFKKTPKMREVEGVVGGDLGKFLTVKYASDSPRAISAAIRDISGGKVNIRRETIVKWSKAYGIQVRSQLEGVKLAWQSPQERKAMIAAVHSPEASKNRGKAISRYWKKLSEEEKKERLELLERIRQKVPNSKLLLEQNIQKTLGNNPEKVLRRMYWDQGLSPKAIGQTIGKSSTTVIKWMRHLGIERRKSGDGFIKTDRKVKQSIVQEARDRGLIWVLTPKELAVTNARYPEGSKISSFSAIQKNSYPNSQAKTRQAIQDTEKRAREKLKRALMENPS